MSIEYLAGQQFVMAPRKLQQNISKEVRGSFGNGDGVVECDGGDGEGFAVFDLKARLKTASGSAANWGGMSR